MDAIPKNCPSLREFMFRCSKHYSDYLDAADIVWENVGSKLESLSVSQVRFSEDVLKRMREQWNPLKRIGIYYDITQMVSSYGDQLDFVCVYDMPEHELNHTAESCMNSRFRTFVNLSDILLHTLRILGPRLQSIVTYPDFGNQVHSEEWAAAWSLCEI